MKFERDPKASSISNRHVRMCVHLPVLILRSMSYTGRHIEGTWCSDQSADRSLGDPRPWLSRLLQAEDAFLVS